MILDAPAFPASPSHEDDDEVFVLGGSVRQPRLDAWRLASPFRRLPGPTFLFSGGPERQIRSSPLTLRSTSSRIAPPFFSLQGQRVCKRAKRADLLANYDNLVAEILKPMELRHLPLRLVQSNWRCEDSVTVLPCTFLQDERRLSLPLP